MVDTRKVPAWRVTKTAKTGLTDTKYGLQQVRFCSFLRHVTRHAGDRRAELGLPILIFSPEPRGRACSSDIQLAIALVDAVEGDCEQVAAMPATLPGANNEPLILQFSLRLKYLVA